MFTTYTSLSPPLLLLISIPKSHNSLNAPNSFLPLTLPTTTLNSKRTINFHTPTHRIPQKSNQIWRISSTPEDDFPLQASPLDNSQEIVSTNDDRVFSIISFLLFIAFVTLTILTIGVIYIGVTDFLQKREREKFEKEEGAKKKKGGKKGKVRARAGPRGFGQKIDQDDYNYADADE